MSHLFISGIPTAGKSYLAQSLAEQLGGLWIETDQLRDELQADPNKKQWVNFFWDKDPDQYFATTTADQRWHDFVQQSEAFWPHMKKRMEEIMRQDDCVIFEGVNLLPHLTIELSLPGIYLLGDSLEETIRRNTLAPRWGKEESQIIREAKDFFTEEGPRYEKEAKNFGYRVFGNIHAAEEYAINILECNDA